LEQQLWFVGICSFHLVANQHKVLSFLFRFPIIFEKGSFTKSNFPSENKTALGMEAASFCVVPTEQKIQRTARPTPK
jgi:hypothetical protein